MNNTFIIQSVFHTIFLSKSVRKKKEKKLLMVF